MGKKVKPMANKKTIWITRTGVLLALLLANPLSIAGVGLQLSFASMVGLLVLSPRIYTLFPSGRSRLWRFARSSLSASLGATICTAPLTAFYFNRIPLVGPIANILVGSVATFTFLSGAAALILGLLAPVLGSFAGLLPQAGVWYTLAVARLFAKIPYHAIYFTNPYLKYWLVFLAVIFGYCALTPKARRKYLLATGLAAGTLALLLYVPVYSRAGRLHAVAVDVGQGASTILSSQGATALVDCGSSENFINAGDEAGDTLNTYGYFGLDYLILTHYDYDHVSGVTELLARTRVGTLLLPDVADRYLRIPSGISKDISKLLQDAGIQTTERPMNLHRKKPVVRYSMHSFRHTFCTLSVNRGISVPVIQSIVGHSTALMTSHYSHISLESKRKAIQAISLLESSDG